MEVEEASAGHGFETGYDGETRSHPSTDYGALPEEDATSDAAAHIRLHIRLYTPPWDRTFAIDLPAESTVLDLKRLLHERLGVPPAFQRLLLAGRYLKNDRRFCDCRLDPSDVVCFHTRPRNGIPPPRLLYSRLFECRFSFATSAARDLLSQDQMDRISGV